MGSRKSLYCLKALFGTMALLLTAGPTEPAKAQRVADDAQPMEDFLYPLEFHENGKVKTRLQAKKVGQTSGEDVLRAEGVILEFLDEEESVTGKLEAEDCVIDRDKGVASSKTGAIRFERDGLVLTGRGFLFYMETQRVEILKDVRLEISERPDRLVQAVRGGPDGGKKAKTGDWRLETGD